MDSILPPNSAEAERAFLGSALVDYEVGQRFRDALQPQDFYYIQNQQLWKVIQALAKRGQQTDYISVSAALGEKAFQELGGEAWIADLTNIPSALHAETYADIVSAHAERRRILRACEQIAKVAFTDAPVTDLRALVIKATGEAMGAHGSNIKHQGTILKELLARLEAIERGEIDPSGISTGLTDLDKLTDGLFTGEMTILGGRPGMGKSGLLATIADHISRRGRRRVLVFSLEMDEKIWMGRVLAQVAAVDSRKIVRGKGMDAEEWARVYEHSPSIIDAPAWVDDSRGLTILDIRTRARKMAADVGGLDLVIVDHLTIIKNAMRLERHDLAVSANVLSLREMAKELNCHVLCAAQLNRKLEDRAEKRPQLSDFKESGGIEEHADNVWGLHREEVYDPDTLLKGIAELMALKGRNGLTGKIEMMYDPVKQRFGNLQRINL